MSNVLRIAVAGCLLSCIALAGPPVGWRGDGTGRYPGAQPITQWSDPQNVIWKTPLPAWSGASPVLAGGRVFVTCEPTTLVCCDADDGRVLLQQTNTYADAHAGEPDAKAKALLAAQIEAKIAADKLAKRRLGSPATTRGASALTEAEVVKREAALDAELDDLAARLQEVVEFSMPPTHRDTGYAPGTPVSNGKRVWAAFSTGVVACYDMVGNRQWILQVAQPWRKGQEPRPKFGWDWGHSSSPLLVGDTLVVRLTDLIGLDAATGREKWRVQDVGAGPQYFGTPAVVRVGDVDVVVTPRGDLYRASDGKEFAKGLMCMGYSYPSPVAQDGTVYMFQGYDEKARGWAVRLSPGEQGGDVKAELLWKVDYKVLAPSHHYIASPVVIDGLVYALMGNNALCVIDARDGGLLYQEVLDLTKKSFTYPSLTLAGKQLWAGRGSGRSMFLQPSRTPKLVATNEWEATESTPVLSGDRVYYRGLKNLWCIGPAKDATTAPTTQP